MVDGEPLRAFYYTSLIFTNQSGDMFGFPIGLEQYIYPTISCLGSQLVVIQYNNNYMVSIG